MQELCRLFQESWDDPQGSKEISRHGLACAECREFVRRQELLQNSFEVWRSPEISEDFTLSVVSRLAEESRKNRNFRDVLYKLLHLRMVVPLPVGALVSILLTVSIGLNLFFWKQNRPEVSNPANLMNIVQTVPPDISVVPAKNGFTPFSQNWTGTGVFLLIPMVDLNIPSFPKMEPKPRSTVKANRI